MDQKGIPELGVETERAGRWIENACLAHAWNSGQNVRYWREEPLEVDAVLDGSWGSWAIEVKTGPIHTADLRGLLEFTRRFPKYQALLIGDSDNLATAQRAGISFRTWQDFLISGPDAHP